MAQLVRSAITVPCRRWRGSCLAGSAGALALLSAASSAPAQTGECQWIQRRGLGPTNTTGLAAAWDAQRQRIVIANGWRTWEWNGDGWLLPRLATAPPSTTGYALAFDGTSGRLLMFGGRPARSEMWEYDGELWRQLSPAPGPEGRHSTAMAYDSARQRVVLFGGTNAANQWLNDTWEWDGQSWSLRSSAGPLARADHAMAYDAARQRTVLFGGGQHFGDTWEWDGSSWALRAQTGPPPRISHTLTYDPARQQVVLFGGSDAAARFNDIWAFDGDAWIQQHPQSPERPSPRSQHTAAWFGPTGSMIVHGGRESATSLSRETWSWDGAGWMLQNMPAPFARFEHTTAYDTVRGKTLIFGGPWRDMWAWDGDAWQERPVLNHPQLPFNTAVAFDEARGELVMFSGQNPFPEPPAPITWIWDGQSWSIRSTSGPPARVYHAMTWDSIRERVVLFGGGLTIAFNDTWEWDGQTWTEMTIAGPVPPAQGGGHRLAFDRQRGVAVLLTNDGDTWEYDGRIPSWTLRGVAGPDRWGYAMAYHPWRGTVVMYGGSSGPGGLCYGVPCNDTWEWNGSQWRQLEVDGPRGRDSMDMAWDSARGRMVLFGGNMEGRHTPADDTWELVCTLPPPVCYANCDQSTVAPILNVDDFTCFINRYAGALLLPQAQQVMHYANCDGSTVAPVLNVDDFSCFINRFAAGCP
jgi:hypothetical protein